MRTLRLCLLLLLLTSVSLAQWVQTSGPEGGQVYATAYNGSYVFAGLNVGVYRSGDNGANWTSGTSGLSDRVVYALAVSGTNLFAGTQGTGVFVSADDGMTWTPANSGISSSQVRALAVKGPYLFAGVSGGGVYRSSDDGGTWGAVNVGLTNLNVRALAVKGSTLFAGTSNGIYRSIDDGGSWSLDTTGIYYKSIYSFAVVGSAIYAGSWGGGVYRSTDDGLTWTSVIDGLTSLQVHALGVHGTDLFAGTWTGGIFRSTDLGATWNAVNTGLTATAIFSFVSTGTDLFAGTEGGMFRSGDGGVTWTMVNTGIIATCINAYAVYGPNLFAATQGGGVFRSTNNGASWTTVNTGLTNTIVNTISFKGSRLFAGTYGGAFMSTDFGASWAAVNNGLTYGTGVWAFATLGSTLYAGTIGGGVFASTNDGATWTPVNSGGITNLDIYSLAIRGSKLFAGSKDGEVFVTANGGTTWSPIPIGGSFAAVYALAVDGTHLYAGTLGDGVFRSTDDGATWTAMNSGMTDTWVTSFAFSGKNVFAGTLSGVFRSTDGGAGWNGPSSGWSTPGLWSLAVNGSDLYAGTEQSGAWRQPLSNFFISEIPQLIVAGGFSVDYFYHQVPRADGIAVRGDGTLLVVAELGSAPGVFLASKDKWWSWADAYSSLGPPFGNPDDIVLYPNGYAFVVDNGSNLVIRVPMGGGAATPYVRPSDVPLPNAFNPLGIAVAPRTFSGPNVLPGDLVVADNAASGSNRAVWGVNGSTGTVRGAIAQGGMFTDGPLQVAFGLDGVLYVYENNFLLGVGRIVTLSASGAVTEFLNDIPGTGSLTIHPVTGELFFSVGKLGVAGEKILRISPKIAAPQTYPGSAVEVASGFASLQDMEFSPDGLTLYVSAMITNSWDVLAISVPSQFSVDWYLDTAPADNMAFRGIAVDRTSSRIYICDYEHDVVRIYPNNGSNIPIGSFRDPSWLTLMLGPYGIDVSDDDYVYVSVANVDDVNGDGQPDHALWRSNLDGSQLTQLCLLPNFPRDLHVVGVGSGTAVFVSGSDGYVIRCTPISANQFRAEILFPTGITLNQQDVVSTRMQSSLYVSSWFNQPPFLSPVTKWDTLGNRDVGFNVWCVRGGDVPGVDLDRSESSLYVFNTTISQLRYSILYKVDARTGTGISGILFTPWSGYAGGGIAVGRDGKIYVARTTSGASGSYVSTWGRITDVAAGTPLEFQAPAGAVSEVFADGIIRPIGLAVDGQRRLLAAESGTGNIYRYESKTSSSLFATGFGLPFDLAVDGVMLYVTDRWNGTIYRKDMSVGTPPFTRGDFTPVVTNVVDPSYLVPGTNVGYPGKLFVSMAGGVYNGRVYEVDVATGDTATFVGFGAPGNVDPQGMVATTSGDMYICVHPTGSVVKAPSSTPKPADGSLLSAALTSLDSPGGIALGSDDRLYVATKSGVVVSRRDSKTWTTFVAGLSGGIYNNIEHAGSDQFYIADYLGNRILRVALPQTQKAPTNAPFSFMINSDGHPNITDESEITAIRNAFQRWQDLATCAVSFKDDGLTSAKYASMSDGVNLVTFTDDKYLFSPGVLAIVAKTLQMDATQQTATIVDADVVFNPEFVRKMEWGLSTDTYPALPDSLTFDIESIATHEIGHILGLVHSGSPTSAMFFVLQPNKTGRTLQPDDIAWASYRYPDGDFNTACGSIEGKVIYGYDPVKGVAGGLLLARNSTTGAYYHSYSDEDGNYHIPGLPPGTYHILLRALNGKVFGYPMKPENISAYLYAVTSITDYPGEWYSANESATDNTHDSSLVAVSAGQVTGGINIITNTDVIGPSVTGVSPVNSAQQVDVFAPIVVTFSEAVDPASITAASITLSSPSAVVGGTYTLLSANKAVVFAPSVPLSGTTLYTLTVNDGVLDAKGNALDPVHASTFTTGQADLTIPTVAQVAPAENATGVFVTTQVSVRFSKRMDATSVTAANFYLTEGTNPTPVVGTVTLTQDNMVATLTPSSNLVEGVSYTVHVTDQVKDAFANALSQPFTSTFTTVSGPPQILTIGPANGANAVSVTSPVLVDFSKAVDSVTVTAQSIALTTGGSPVQGAFEFLNDHSRVLFRPSTPLMFGTSYKVEVTTAITDLAHHALAAGQTATFTTATLSLTPVITSIDPPAATKGTTVVIAGSGFDPNPARNTVTFNGIIAGASSSSSGSITTVVPDGVTPGFVNVVVTVGQSESGSHLFDVLMPLFHPQDNIIAGASTGSQPKNVTVTPDGAYAFVTNFASNTVSVIGLATTPPTVGTSIPVGTNPLGIAVTPDGARAYVTNYGSNTVSVIDLNVSPMAVVGTITVGMNPWGIAILPDGSRIYVANSGSNSISVIDGDPHSGAFNQIIAGAPTPSTPKDVAISPDGTLAFVTGGNALLIIDVNPSSGSYNQIIGQAGTTSQTKDVAVTPDGTMAIVTTNDGSILLICVSPKSPAFGEIIAGAGTTSGADKPAPSPDGTRVYVTSQATNSVMVYDITYASGVTPGATTGIVTTGITLKLSHTITVGTSPGGIAIGPYDQRVVVANAGSNDLTVISVSGVSDEVLQTLGQLGTTIQSLIDKSTTSKKAAGNLKRAQDALREATGLIRGGDVAQAFDRMRQAIHELQLSSIGGRIVSDMLASLAQAADRLVQDAIKTAKSFPVTSVLSKKIADAEADLQRAQGYVSRGDVENAMTCYKNAWDKAQLAIALGIQGKKPGNEEAIADELEAPTLPTEIALGQNYPNPFNATTQIVFDIPASATGGIFVELKVYNLLGQVVRTLVNDVKAPGSYLVTWNGKRDDGGSLASGVYIVHFKAGSYSRAKKVVLMQ